MVEEQKTTPSRLSRMKKKTKAHRRPYRLGAVAAAGFLGSLLIILAGMFLYTLIAYIGRLDVEYAVTVPSLLLFLAVAFGTFLSGIIIGGKSPLPGSIVAGFYFLISLYQSIAHHPTGSIVSVKGIFLKLLLLLAAVLVGWVTSWVLTMLDSKRRQQKRARRQKNTSAA